MKAKTTYLEFYKQILGKISFDQCLFVKEYQKAMKLLDEAERKELEYWIHQQYQKPPN